LPWLATHVIGAVNQYRNAVPAGEAEFLMIPLARLVRGTDDFAQRMKATGRVKSSA